MIRYQLKQPNLKGETLIYCTYYFGGTKLKISTGEKIHPSHWNPDKGRPRASAENAGTLTIFLDRLETKVKELHLTMKSEFVPITPHTLKQRLQNELRTGGKRETLSQYIDRYIKENSDKKLGSLQVYKSIQKIFNAYHGAKDFDDINADWFRVYQKYMERSGYSANYIGKNVAVIQELMTKAKSQGLHRNELYKLNDYEKPREEVDSIYLTTHELLKMYGIELPENLDRVRNRAMIGAFTCLRFSDSAKITIDSVRDGLIFDRNKKTGNNVIVPVHWVVQQIFDQHPDGLPPSISNQKTNKHLKTIAKLAGIDTPITVNKTVGGKLVTETKKKYELVTTHCMRRSAATNMVLQGVPIKAIMMIGGWKTEESFRKYIRISLEENARWVQGHEYYQEYSTPAEKRLP